VTSSSSTNGFSEDGSPAGIEAGTPGGFDVSPVAGRKRERRRRSRSSQLASRVGIVLGAVVLVAAPLVVGGVHRVPMILLMALCLVALGAMVLGSSAQRPLRCGAGVVLPLVLLVIPIIQSLPLPMTVRGLVDPRGNVLLTDNDIVTPHAWPLSLDPPLTREAIGKAAAALAMFVIAYHLASGQSRRHLVARLVGATGIAAVFIGLGHKFLGFTEIYGLFVSSPPRSLLAGPFVNANHTAEFLELATFACVACALQRDAILNRYGWLTGALLCATGALATLSRGAVVGLLAGALLFAFLRRSSREEGPGARRGVVLAWSAAAVLLVVGMAAWLGAGELMERFRTSSLTEEARFQLWRDAFRVLAAHPAGIGRGAFEHVYPIYRTVKNWFPVTFAFLENHPLQLLVDSGWLLFGLILAAVAVVIREIAVRGRRDRIEAALLAGLFAVTAHSFLDFALETLGVAIPFAAILGTVLGRGRGAENAPMSSRATSVVVGLTCASLVFGAIATAHPSDDDFDKALKRAHGMEEARAILRRAQETHPTDYFYALSYARTEPLKSGSGPSPRLHALNRAMRLCPGCEQVHAEVGRTLWKMGLRSQAVLEWRVAAASHPAYFRDTLMELWRSGAKPTELAAVASFDPAKMIEAAEFLAEYQQLADALTVVDEAEVMGAPRTESLLTRCRLQTRLGQLAAAQTTLAEARAAGIQDPRLAVLEANLILANKGAGGAAEALAILDLAATRYPLDVDVQRLRVSVVGTYGKWQAADRAIDGFKLALFRATGGALEANIAAARIRVQLSQWNAAFSEYRLALTQPGSTTSLWVELGRAAETAGRDSTAREAYAEAARQAPADHEIAAALRRVEARQTYGRPLGSPPPGP
jgi:tetratricopeptide (TPR) repeat protein/O-antigen ligase